MNIANRYKTFMYNYYVDLKSTEVNHFPRDLLMCNNATVITKYDISNGTRDIERQSLIVAHTL